MEASTNTASAVLRILSWVFYVIFLVTGILNLILVHPVPGIFYILLSFIYLPQTNIFLKNRFGFTIPSVVKIAFGFVILWGTLAVGDLAEILGL